jgi:hypothetical protein
MDQQQYSRRNFLARCGACVAYASCSASAAKGSLVLPQGALQNGEKPKIRLVFTHIPPEKPTWPYEGYDYEGRKQALTARLRAACPSVEFLPTTAMNAAEARKLLEADREVDGYLVYMIGIWTGAPQVIASSGRPTLFVDDLYAGSGELLIAYSDARRKGYKVAAVASSRFEDVVEAVKTFECIKKLRSSVILDVTERDPGVNAQAIQEMFGATVRRISGTEITEVYTKVDKTQAQAIAKRWIKEAKKVVEPTEEEIQKSGAMYLAMRGMLDQHRSQAVTIDCLNLFYASKLPAYPCLGLFQFNNDGLVGACEADLQSTITMLTMTYLVGRPGYISDPVIDTSKNQIIYAHCVAPNKVYGPKGPSNPYHIRSHSEDRKGAAVRSLLPLGEITTTLKFHPPRKEVVIHQARTVANIDEDKACRTKLAAEVRDVRKLMTSWDLYGWHRVTFFGDFKRQVETVAALLGFRVIEEG